MDIFPLPRQTHRQGHAGTDWDILNNLVIIDNSTWVVIFLCKSLILKLIMCDK